MLRAPATLVAVIAAAALALAAAPAVASEKARCTVLTIHATNKDGTTDPRLEQVPELKKPPFNMYKTFHLLSEKDYSLKKDVPVTLSLPAGSGLQGKLVFKGTNKALKELNFKLYLIKGSGKNKKEVETSFAVRGKAPFFYVRPFKKGQLIIHIMCGEPDKKSSSK